MSSLLPWFGAFFLSSEVKSYLPSDNVSGSFPLIVHSRCRTIHFLWLCVNGVLLLCTVQWRLVSGIQLDHCATIRTHSVKKVHITNTFAIADNSKTRGHFCELTKKSLYTLDATQFYFWSRVVNVWNSLSDEVQCSFITFWLCIWTASAQIQIICLICLFAN